MTIFYEKKKKKFSSANFVDDEQIHLHHWRNGFVAGVNQISFERNESFSKFIWHKNVGKNFSIIKFKLKRNAKIDVKFLVLLFP